MIPGLPFGVFRWTILSLAVLSQIYLFFLARRAIRSSQRSERFKDRTVNALGVLLEIFQRRDLVTVRTSLGTFVNMAMTSLNVPRGPDTGNALRFSARFQQVVTVSNARVAVKQTATRTSGPKLNRGPQTPLFKVQKAVVWRKGIIYRYAPNQRFDRAGAQAFAYSGGAPDIGDSEIVFWVQDPSDGFWVHSDIQTPLTDGETRRLKLDLARDAGRLRKTPTAPTLKGLQPILPEYDESLRKHLKPIDLNSTNAQQGSELPPHLRGIQPLPEGFKL